MKIPARNYTLPGGYSCPAITVASGTWQDHLVRHPLGAHGKMRGNAPAPWNLEGWDHTIPPVITESRRARLLAKIGDLRDGAYRCKVPEFTTPPGTTAGNGGICKSCRPSLVRPCTQLLNEEDLVGSRYAAITEALLAAVEEAIVVSATAFKTAVLRVAMKPPGNLDSLTVLSFGVARSDDDLAIARVSRGDGTRAEFYVDRALRQLCWRTTYRLAASRSATHQFSSREAQFVTELAINSSRFGSLSDACVVARQWWQDHGN